MTMTRFQRLKKQLVAWRHLLILFTLTLPFWLLCALGIRWLFENDAVMAFIFVSGALGILAALTSFIANRPSHNQVGEQPTADDGADIAPNPEWSHEENRVFSFLCVDIHQRTESSIAWEHMQSHMLEITQLVATQLKGNNSQLLDFSAPEILLLVEQTARRYRLHLRDNLPFIDQISLRQIQWFWRNRKHFSTAWKIADSSRRVARFVANPGGAALKELELLMTGGHSQYLSDQVTQTLQTLLLEEIAASAIDLYSGRLKFSEPELRLIALKTQAHDIARLAQEDMPLRLCFIGQTSSGKSSLINHLLNSDKAETDVTPTTQGLTTYETRINNVACYLIDTPGINGDIKNIDLLLDTITDCDLIIWLNRADRPARSLDETLFNCMNARFENQPNRRRPPIITVITHIDRIINDWPFPEHHLSPSALKAIESVTQIIAQLFNTDQTIPIANTVPTWNIQSVIQAIDDCTVDALMTQKNRKRINAERSSNSIVQNSKRGAKGLYRGLKIVGKRWLLRQH